MANNKQQRKSYQNKFQDKELNKSGFNQETDPP